MTADIRQNNNEFHQIYLCIDNGKGFSKNENENVLTNAESCCFQYFHQTQQSYVLYNINNGRNRYKYKAVGLNLVKNTSEQKAIGFFLLYQLHCAEFAKPNAYEYIYRTTNGSDDNDDNDDNDDSDDDESTSTAETSAIVLTSFRNKLSNTEATLHESLAQSE